MNAIFTQTLGTRSLVVLTVLSLLVSLMPVTASAVAIDVYGCTDPTADNYDPAANIDDNSCVYTLIPGCTDPAADNYDPAAEEDDGSCDYGPTEVDLEIIKAISGETLGFELSDFSYQVTGNGVNETVPHGGTVALPIGTYSIEELVPDSFVKEDWRIGWYGQCDAGSAYTTSITITESNVDHGLLYCTADNQYRPAEYLGCTDSHALNYDSLATVDDGSCEYPDTPDYGCTDDAAVNYDPDALYDDGSCSYDEVYGCTDVEAINYNPNATTDDQSCEYESDEPTYKVYGYVWHDQNENDVWDEENEVEEPELSGWTVTITNGETTLSTVSGEGGYYEFYVPAGTWTITEEIQSEWTQTFPNNGQHVVEVVDESIEVNDDSESLTFFNLFVATAHAQTATEYGPFDFGNNQTSGGGVGGDSGGGGSRPPSCEAFDITVAGDKATLTWETKRGSSMTIEADGVEIFSTNDDDIVDGDSLEVDYTDGASYELTVSRGSRSDSCGAAVGSADGGGPTPLVLGDQVSAVPVGGAHAGAGGAAPTPVETPNTSFVAALFGAMRRRNG